MINLKVDSRFIEDLHDDIMVNEELDLYEFIKGDPITAFYLGMNLEDWFEELDKKQQYLYSKQARHNQDSIEQYQDQIQFWLKKYPNLEETVDLIAISEYVLNNMIYEEETENDDAIHIAFFLGRTIAANKDENSKNTSTQ